MVCLTVLSRVLCLVSVNRESSACTPSVNMSIAAGVVLFVRRLCALEALVVAISVLTGRC